MTCCVFGTEGLRFKSRAGQIGHSVANGSPPLLHFFKRCCYGRTRNDTEMGPAKSLHGSVKSSEYNEILILNWTCRERSCGLFLNFNCCEWLYLLFKFQFLKYEGRKCENWMEFTRKQFSCVANIENLK